MTTLFQEMLHSPVMWVAVGSAVTAILAKAYRFWRKAQENNDFAYDMATNHLPHIYHAQGESAKALIKIGTALGVDIDIDLDAPPPIRFVSKRHEKD